MRRSRKRETIFYTLKKTFEEELGRPLKKEEQDFLAEMVRNQWKENVRLRSKK